jgi:hypothetical protein
VTGKAEAPKDPGPPLPSLPNVTLLPAGEALGEPTYGLSCFLPHGLVPQVPHPPVVPDEDHRLLDTHTLPA